MWEFSERQRLRTLRRRFIRGAIVWREVVRGAVVRGAVVRGEVVREPYKQGVVMDKHVIHVF